MKKDHYDFLDRLQGNLFRPPIEMRAYFHEKKPAGVFENNGPYSYSAEVVNFCMEKKYIEINEFKAVTITPSGQIAVDDFRDRQKGD